MGGFLSVCITENQFVAAIATVFVNFGSLKLILPEYCSTKKKLSLTISQNSQENICQSLCFNKVAGLSLQLY